jgi:hypothetical protein
MAPVTNGSERRREPRHTGGGSRFGSSAVLRPGQAVTLVNITSHAALVESESRLRPGAVTEMQLAESERRTSIKGRLDRCYVAALEPIRYRGLVVFEQSLDLP